MPLLLDDKAYKELFDHLFDPKQNGDEYVRLNEIVGEDIGYQIGFFDAPSNFELKLMRNPQADIELEIVLLDHYRKRVVYFNRVEVIEGLPLNHTRPVAQVMIWRDRTRHGRIASGLVQNVFFGLLVDEYDVVVSDSEQTREGRGMWQGLLQEAIDRSNLEAATLDKSESEETPLTSEEDLYNAGNWLWGTQEIHKNRLALIRKINGFLLFLMAPAMVSFAGAFPI